MEEVKAQSVQAAEKNYLIRKKTYANIDVHTHSKE